MTLEELKNKKVTITLNKTLLLLEDLGKTCLDDLIEDQKNEGYSDKELIETILLYYYNNKEDIDNTIEFEDYNINIHD